MQKFKKGDKVIHKETRKKDVVKSVPGIEEYDKVGYLGAKDGMVLEGYRWTHQEDWELDTDFCLQDVVNDSINYFNKLYYIDSGFPAEKGAIHKFMEITSNVVTFAKNLTLSKEEKLLRKHGLKDSCGDFTGSAWEIVKQNLMKAAEADLIKIAEAMEEEATKKAN